MGALFFYGLLTFFSAYGVFSFFYFLSDFLSEKKHLQNKCLYSVLFVKDEACRAEQMVKSLLFKVFKNDTGLCERKVIVVDQGSSDATYDTLSAIFEKERNVLVFHRDEFCEKLENL
ncbi:MAG: hypothetical protein IJ278_03135 [Clostridia bacterium]|nr:hypothetical protein [Clostridia bacterium]